MQDWIEAQRVEGPMEVKVKGWDKTSQKEAERLKACDRRGSTQMSCKRESGCKSLLIGPQLKLLLFQLELASKAPSCSVCVCVCVL